MTGQELRRARRKLKMTQREVAAELELHKNTIARMERDELPIVKTTELAVRFLLVKKGGTK
jgi:transcriptional regulator with XRE-family HTH domain